MSLSQEPALSVLKNELVCGYRDISKEPYAGFSGAHPIDGNAAVTTNGAGPHNLQTFIMDPDGTVLHCLPGYWAPQDLVREVEFAGRLDDVWHDPHLSVAQKKQEFREMQLAHVQEHPRQMTMKSRMQGFDMQYEAKNRLYSSDTILNPQLAVQVLDKDSGGMKMGAKDGFKTTDVIMHERMAQRPFINYNQFDVAAYADYGRPKYDKNENFRDASTGQISDNNKEAAKHQQMLGQVPEKPMKRNRGAMMGQRMAQRGVSSMVRRGVRSVLWGQ